MKKYFSIITFITLAIALSSCKKTFLSELAVNPNTPASTTAPLELAGALTRTATLTNGTNYVTFLGWDNFVAYNTGTQPSVSLLQYSINTGTFDFFSPLYLNIANYNAVLTATQAPYFQAIAKIMIAYDYEQLVDIYNDVPYSQTLGGLGNLTPIYESGSVIYDKLMLKIDSAITQIQVAQNLPAATPPIYPGSADLVYAAGTSAAMNKWIQFANTLKLRLAVHQTSNAVLFTAKKAMLISELQTLPAVPASNPNGVLSAAAIGYVTTASEGSVNPGYTNVDVLQSPLDVAYGYTAAGKNAGSGATYLANSYAVNFLVGTGTPLAPQDPRLFQIYAPSVTATALGAVVGTGLGQTTAPVVNGKTATQSRFATYALLASRSAPLLQASEAYFLQAEAIKAGLLVGAYANEATAYNNGVISSFIEDGVGGTFPAGAPTTGAASGNPIFAANPTLATTLANTYLSSTGKAYPVAGSSSDAREQRIITEKWISFDPFNPLEAYTEIRRTGYPAVPLSALAPSAPGYVNRIPYPTTEYNTNANNVPTNIDIYASKIFWQP